VLLQLVYSAKHGCPPTHTHKKKEKNAPSSKGRRRQRKIRKNKYNPIKSRKKIEILSSS